MEHLKLHHFDVLRYKNCDCVCRPIISNFDLRLRKKMFPASGHQKYFRNITPHVTLQLATVDFLASLTTLCERRHQSDRLRLRLFNRLVVVLQVLEGECFVFILVYCTPCEFLSFRVFDCERFYWTSSHNWCLIIYASLRRTTGSTSAASSSLRSPFRERYLVATGTNSFDPMLV